MDKEMILSQRARTCIRSFFYGEIGCVPWREEKKWEPTDSMLRRLTIMSLKRLPNVGVVTLAEIIAYAKKRGIDIKDDRNPSRTHADLTARHQPV